jgi:hypothetical protein
LVPVAAGAGGATTWSERLLALLPSTAATPDARARQLAANTAISFGTLLFSLGPAVLMSAVAAPHAVKDVVRMKLRSDIGVFWTLWIVPAFTFLWLVDSTEPGHDLVFTVALVALGAGLLAYAADSARRLALFGGIVVAVQAITFVFAAPLYGRPLAWTLDSMLLNVTAPGIRDQQSSLDSTLQTIRSRFSPDDAVLVTLVDQDPYRFLMYYLPEYSVLRLDPATQSVLAARDRRQGSWTQLSDCMFAAVSPIPVRYGVWVVSRTSEPGLVPAAAQHLTEEDQSGPFDVWAVDRGASGADYLGFKMGAECVS